MAKADVTTPPPVFQPPSEIVLTLTIAEAKALATVLDNVGGSPHLSRRGLTNEIHEALRGTGVRGNSADIDRTASPRGGSIYFKDKSND